MNQKQLRKTTPSVLIFIPILILTILLAGCGIVDTEITVYTNDRYKQDFIITLPADAIDMYGGEEEFENEMRAMMSDELSSEGKFSVKQLKSNDPSVYRYEISQGMTNITTEYNDNFSWTETRFNNRKAYEFRYSRLGSFLSGVSSMTITLHAGKILDTNGTQLDANTVQWTDPWETPYAIVIPKGAATWIPLVALAVLIIAVAVGLYFLITSGKIKQWWQAGTSSGKWRIESLKLGNEIKNAEEQKNLLVTDLGKKAWQNRTEHESYAEHFDQMQAQEQLRAELAEERQSLESQVKDVRQTRDQVENKYNEQIKGLQEQRKTASNQLNQLQESQKGFTKQLESVKKEHLKMQDEWQSFQNKLEQVKASTDPRRDEQIANLNDGIAALSNSMIKANNDIPQLEAQVSQIEEELTPIKNQVEDLENNIEQAKTSQKEEVKPLSEKIESLDKQIAGLKEKERQHQQKLDELVTALGPMVNQARPDSAALNTAYSELDQKQNQLDELNQQQGLLKARISALDSKAVTSFYIFIGASVIVVLLFLVLIYFAFA